MALISLDTADGTLIGNPSTGDYFLFLDSNNSDFLTLRDSTGLDSVYTTGVIPANMESRIIVNQSNVATTLGGTIDSSKEYFLDGVIDMGATQIDLSGGKGLNIRGYDFNTSGLTSSENSYTMIIGADAGDVLWSDFKIEVTGTSSKVLDITDGTGFHAFEISRINFNNCTSRGTLNGYRQGLETGTGYFGGKPELTLAGTWIGGYFIDTSLVRNLTDGSYSLFKAGAGFTMASRFRSNQNIDLNTSVSFLDFSTSNFANPSTLQLENCLISRNGVFNASDTNILPNISQNDVVSSFKSNMGINNTFVGGKLKVSTATETDIALGGTYYDFNGTWTANNLSHFDTPSAGQLRHLGVNPIEFKVQADFTVESIPNNVLSVRIRVWRNSTSTFLDFTPQVRQVNSLVGGRDVAFFTIFSTIKLNQNDYLYFQIANNTDNNNATLELESFFYIEER